MEKQIKNSILEISYNFKTMAQMAPQINQATKMCIDALKKGNKVMFCGNGGSASQSQHLAAELVGRYKLNRPAMNSIALTTDTSILTAVGNDYGYDTIFERQVQGIGKPGDVLIGLSTSGNSKNIVLAFDLAKKKNIKTIALTGQKPSAMSEKSDLTLNVPSNITNNIQEMHLAIGHILCGLIEQEFYGKTK